MNVNQTNDIRGLTALELGRLIKERKISSLEAARIYIDAIKREDGEIGAYISVFEEAALAQAEAAQKLVDSGVGGPLAGVPAAVKDAICVKGERTTAGSKILEDFRPPYDAHIIEKMKEAGAVIIGKANLDEFAMGGSTETSYFGVTRNPWDLERVPGGSSGGSAAAVAAGLAPYAIGSDTGGSIRQPCAFCNLTGIKPTYGSVSRYGLMAYASSLDQIGPVGKDVRDCAAVLSMISGRDKRDSTSVIEHGFDFSWAWGGAGGSAGSAGAGNGSSWGGAGGAGAGNGSAWAAGGMDGAGGSAGAAGTGTADGGRPLDGLRIALPTNYFAMGLAEDVKDAVLKAAKAMSGMGAQVDEIEIPLIEYAVPAYYIIACAEASSNLSRYDGVKYGFRSKEAGDILEMFYKSRSEGFGAEVKRRIMLGSFVLSSGYFDAYYKKALQVRGLIKGSFDEALQQHDFILSPVSPTPAYRIGQQISDPLAMYLADIYTVSLNLSGLPGIALPCGFDREGMPIGMQLIGKPFSEGGLIRAGLEWQAATDYHKKRPEPRKGRGQAE
ncbi:MAG: aspartyl/glutamyl-tRNA amidotransferase subunit A [Clostridiales Family XIII bacterium]|jgi:aspartyl-tRNA(Asn)/glutamyl-tRNA(Gln) amidotransferase subunit A|nr:aspartyl/glutamyl-tRNA amidotransferase subunit A [Clostridiales Family XIII bacterium]